MKPEEQQIKIAEFLGWKVEEKRIGSRLFPLWGESPKPPHMYEKVPDFINDLNAMHAAINQQPVNFQEEFDAALRSLNGLVHQSTSTQWAEIFIDIALRKGIIKQ